MDGMNEQEAKVNGILRSKLLERNAMILKKNKEMKITKEKNVGGGRGRTKMNQDEKKASSSGKLLMGGMQKNKPPK